jgi:dethiobiotin synthetase
MSNHESRVTSHESRISNQGFFVTGTDTGVGKTLIACALLRALGARGLRVIGMKPVAAGARWQDGRLVNDDVTALKAAGNVSAPDELMNPYCFEPPIAPHIAAANVGVSIDLNRLREAYAALAATAQCVIVEGAGGILVPLGADFDTADLAADLGLPVILVVGMRLGCLNHALLTAAAIHRVGLPIACWVANQLDPHMLCTAENLRTLRERLHAPLLAHVSYTRNIDASRVARELEIEALYTNSAH